MTKIRRAAVEITTALMHELLQLPKTTRVTDMFIDPWTKNLVLTCEDEQFPEHKEGHVMPHVTPVYEKRVENYPDQEGFKIERTFFAGYLRE